MKKVFGTFNLNLHYTDEARYDFSEVMGMDVETERRISYHVRSGGDLPKVYWDLFAMNGVEQHRIDSNRVVHEWMVKSRTGRIVHRF